MPEIMRQYGQTMIVAVAGAALCALLFATWPAASGPDDQAAAGSVIEHVGAGAAAMLEGSSTGTGTAVFDEHAARKAPRAAARKSVRQHETFTLLDAFKIVDSDGARWDAEQRTFVLDGQARGGAVWITSVRAPSGTELVGALTGTHESAELTLVQTQSSAARVGTATFHKVGVYQVRLRVMDGHNLEATYTIPLAVDLAKPAA